MHNLLKPLLLAWQPANLILTHNTRIQPPHRALVKHANIFFCTLLLLLESSLTNEDLLNNSLINYYVCSKQMLNSVWWGKIPPPRLENSSRAALLGGGSTMCSWKEDFYQIRNFTFTSGRINSDTGPLVNVSAVGGKRMKRIQKTGEIHSDFDGARSPVIIPLRPARCSTYSFLHVQNMPKSFSPTFILNQSTLIFLRNC